MPIPSQNDFLRPFLTILSDGQTYTRSQLQIRLVKHFGISDEEAQQMSGKQLTLVNRVAWCDAHFVKSGFVNKRQHHADSMQDQFRITSLGIRELNRRPEKITVGYLQGFYRGKVHRGAGSDDTTSDAELELYEAFEKLPDEFTVFHSVKWFAKVRGTVGELESTSSAAYSSTDAGQSNAQVAYIKKFFTDKGYGFIQQAAGDDLFVHIRNIINSESIREGARVEYQIGQGRKGPEATHVHILD